MIDPRDRMVWLDVPLALVGVRAGPMQAHQKTGGFLTHVIKKLLYYIRIPAKTQIHTPTLGDYTLRFALPWGRSSLPGETCSEYCPTIDNCHGERTPIRNFGSRK